jgi:hypothetical protein
MKIKIVEEYGINFETQMNIILANDPPGLYVQDIQYSIKTNGAHAAMIVYGDIPTT